MNTNFQIIYSFNDNLNDNILSYQKLIDLYNILDSQHQKNGNLSFTIVDIGKTIYENVTSYLAKNNLDLPDNTLKWAILPGHSTKSDEAPGGLGFSTLLEFLKLNKGSFTLISANEVYKIRHGNKQNQFEKLTSTFPGTIVTITINLKDKQFYILDEITNNLITF